VHECTHHGRKAFCYEASRRVQGHEVGFADEKSLSHLQKKTKTIKKSKKKKKTKKKKRKKRKKRKK
jgi:hypothetical protein